MYNEKLRLIPQLHFDCGSVGLIARGWVAFRLISFRVVYLP